jgi:hypothetical protein
VGGTGSKGVLRYRDRVYGVASVAIIACVAAFGSGVAALSRPPLWLIALALGVPCFGSAAVLSTLTFDVYDDSVCWYFTFRAFRRSVRREDIRDVKTARVMPLGWGYRFEGRRKAWVASGTSFVVISTVAGETLSVNVRNAEAAREAVLRMMAFTG